MGLRSASFGVLDVTQILVFDPSRSARQPAARRARRHWLTAPPVGMNLELTEEEAAALLRELDAIIAADRYFLSPRITTLKEIRSKIRPEPKREPLPPSKHVPPRIGTRRRRG
jgi:hypothetical protein